MLKRAYDLEKMVRSDKVLVVYGPRQVGKTTLVESYLEKVGQAKRVRYVTGDDIEVMDYLGSQSLRKIQEYVAGYEVLIIDEAQKIPKIGESLKLIVDGIRTVRVVVTGSASFELAGQIGEPLTGRKRTIMLYPISQWELAKQYNQSELRGQLEDRLVYGSYPEVIMSGSDLSAKEEVLRELVSSYLLRDVLELERVKSPKLLWDLLRLVAFQIGSEVSLSELGSQLEINKKTVARYLDLLEKSFVLYNLRGYSGNLRKEITKKSKYFFYDTGVRNALIGNLNRLEMRNDVGQLWENWLVMERVKRNVYTNNYGNLYFWRTWDGQEVDLVEERGGKLYGYEIKWGKKRIKSPKDWLGSYNNASYEVVDRENYLEYVS